MKLRTLYKPSPPPRWSGESDEQYERRCATHRMGRFAGRYILGYLVSPFRINLKFHTVPKFWEYYALPKPRATRADASETTASES